MSKKANPTVIGAFVLVGLLIGVAGLIVLGAGSLFEKTERFVLYFDSSLSGLDVGAPVEYAGIQVGVVDEIRLEYNTEESKIQIPVYIEVDPDRMKYLGDGDWRGMEYHRDNGLRAQLQSQSFLTGKVKIMLLIDESVPLRLVGKDPSVGEIPIKPRLIKNLERSFRDFSLTDMVNSVSATIENIERLTGSEDIQLMLVELRKTSESLSALTGSEEFQQTTLEINQTLDGLQELIETARKGAGPVQQDVSVALKEIAGAAKSIKHLTDYLERHPESLLRGKGGE